MASKKSRKRSIKARRSKCRTYCKRNYRKGSALQKKCKIGCTDRYPYENPDIYKKGTIDDYNLGEKVKIRSPRRKNGYAIAKVVMKRRGNRSFKGFTFVG